MKRLCSILVVVVLSAFTTSTFAQERFPLTPQDAKRMAPFSGRWLLAFQAPDMSQFQIDDTRSTLPLGFVKSVTGPPSETIVIDVTEKGVVVYIETNSSGQEMRNIGGLSVTRNQGDKKPRRVPLPINDFGYDANEGVFWFKNVKKSIIPAFDGHLITFESTAYYFWMSGRNTISGGAKVEEISNSYTQTPESSQINFTAMRRD